MSYLKTLTPYAGPEMTLNGNPFPNFSIFEQFNVLKHDTQYNDNA